MKMLKNYLTSYSILKQYLAFPFSFIFFSGLFQDPNRAQTISASPNKNDKDNPSNGCIFLTIK